MHSLSWDLHDLHVNLYARDAVVGNVECRHDNGQLAPGRTVVSSCT